MDDQTTAIDIGPQQQHQQQQQQPEVDMSTDEELPATSRMIRPSLQTQPPSRQGEKC